MYEVKLVLFSNISMNLLVFKNVTCCINSRGCILCEN